LRSDRLAAINPVCRIQYTPEFGNLVLIEYPCNVQQHGLPAGQKRKSAVSIQERGMPGV